MKTNSKLSIAGLLAIVSLGLASCERDRSTEPNLAPWIGQTVTLSADHLVCIPFTSRDATGISRWLVNLDTTAYVMVNADIQSACRQDFNKLIGTVSTGSQVEVVSFLTEYGLLVSHENLQAVLRIEVETPEPSSLLVKTQVESNAEGYVFPWEP
ncbi:MAG: hypothetical protein AAF773_27695 [Cyanobacteria bacterium P01_D01_bin.115]